jgi:hypothetical protein
MYSLNTIIANAIEKSKLGEVGFDKHDIFSSPTLVEKTLGSNKQSQNTATGSGANKEVPEGTIEPEEVMFVEVTWMQPYLAYIINKTLPEDVVEARRIAR